MQLLPVMDLLGGEVVRAVAGDRANYRPIRSALTASSQPVAVLAAYLSRAPFRSLYVADLEAIIADGSRRHVMMLEELGAALAEVGGGELWLDAGAAPWLAELADLLSPRGMRLVPVLGSESFRDIAGYRAFRQAWQGEDCVLSLDFRQGRFLGPREIESDPACWPGRVIVMELSAVGVGGGPALARLAQIREMARNAGRQDVALYAAGGVRDATDLDALAAAGTAGVLLASALHDERIDAASLRRFTNAE